MVCRPSRHRRRRLRALELPVGRFEELAQRRNRWYRASSSWSMGLPTSSRSVLRRKIFSRLAIRWWSRWAPPSGSGITASITPRREQVLRGHFQGLGGLFLEGVALPEDAGAAFGADDRVVGVFEHGHAVADADAQRAARAAFADHHADDRRGQPRHLEHRAGDDLGLAAFFGADARIGAAACRSGR